MTAARAVVSASEEKRVDARPIRVTSDDTLWDRAVAARDACASEMRQVLASKGVRPLVVVSQHGNYPPWARLEAWMPAAGADSSARERVELDMIVDVKPCHKNEIVQTARLKKGRTKFSVSERPVFSNRHVGEWTAHAIGRGPKPSNYRPVRDALVTAVVGFIPPLRPHRNPIARPYRSAGVTLGRALAGGGILLGLLGSALAQVAPGLLVPVVLLWLVGLIAYPFILRRRRHIDAVTSQPEIAPRNLGLVDSWQAVVNGLGGDYGQVREQLHRHVAAAEQMGLKCQWETYGYRTPNGYEERERLVIVKGQSIVQAHVYPFGPDLFVGWHAYLNWAKWDEQKIPTSRIAQGREVAFHALRPGVYLPNLFDLIDLNGVSDLVHRQFERSLRALIAERKIDQEIDFEIVRGDRDLALDKARHVKDGDDATGRWGRIMRAASFWQPASLTEQRQSAAPENSTQSGPPSSSAQAGPDLPATVLLPILAVATAFALQYSGLDAATSFSIPLAGNSWDPFWFTPLATLGHTAVLAFAFVRYADVAVPKALVFAPLCAGLQIVVSYILQSLVALGLDNQVLSGDLGFTAVNYGPSIAASLVTLALASAFAPPLRSPLLWLLYIGAPFLAVPVIQAMDNQPFAYLIPNAISMALIGFWLDKGRGATAGAPTATVQANMQGAEGGGIGLLGLIPLVLALGVFAAVMIPVFIGNAGLGSLSMWHLLILLGVVLLGYRAFRPRQH